MTASGVFSAMLHLTAAVKANGEKTGIRQI